MRRGRRRGLLVVLAVLAGVLLPGTPAHGHATLVATSPPVDAVLSSQPHIVVLTFSEPVTLTAGSIRVYDDKLRRVDLGSAGHMPGHRNRAVVGIPHGIRDGTYLVAWRVVSSDTHPITGTFRFSVGAPSRVAGAVPPQEDGTAVVGAMLTVARFLGFAGIVLFLGVGTMVAFVWPRGRDDRVARRLIIAGALAVTAGTLAELPLRAAYGAGRGPEALLSLDLLEAMLATRTGVVLVARLLFLRLLAALIGGPTRSGGETMRSWRAAGWAACASAFLLTWGLNGHSASGEQPPVALAADTAHLAAMSVWLGGVVLLGARLIQRIHPDEAQVLPRFSAVATGCVTVLVGTGAYQAWRTVGSVPALWTTDYGRLLLAKLGVFTVLLGLGAVANRWVRRHNVAVPAARRRVPVLVGGRSEDPPAAPTTTLADVRAMRRGLLIEAATGAVVLAITAVLAGVPKARGAQPASIERTASGPGLSLRVLADTPVVDRPGGIHLTVTRTEGGRPGRIDVTGSLTLPSRDLGPIKVPFVADGVDHATATNVRFPARGRWRLSVLVRTGPLDATQFTVTIPVR